MMNNIFKHKLKPGKALLLLVILLVAGLTASGCVSGLQPVGWSGGTISEGTLFVGSKEGRLVAVNLADESRIWSEPIRSQSQGGGFGCAPSFGGGCAGASPGVAIYGSPVVGGGLVYIGGYNGKIYAFTPDSLELIWSYPREEYLEPIVGGLTFAADTIYFGSSDGRVYAIDAARGYEKWYSPFQTGDSVWSTPAIEGGTLYVTSFDKKLYALNATDGNKKWEFESGGAIASTPLVNNGIVYFGSFDRHIYAVDAASGKEIWRFPASDEGDNNPRNWFWAEPVIYDNIVYAGCLDGKVYAMDALNGNKVNEFDLQSPVASPPLLINSSIIFVTKQGLIYTLDTVSNKLKLLTDIGKEIYGPLCAGDGIVYIHTQDLTLHPVDIKTGAQLRTISLLEPPKPKK